MHLSLDYPIHMHHIAYVESYFTQLKAVADPIRFRVARVLTNAEAELCICELVDILRMPQYAVSRAAATLRHAGVVQERRDGKLVYYRIATESFVEQLMQLLRSIPADDDEYSYDLDRLRWRIDIRNDGRCVVTYRKESDGMGNQASPSGSIAEMQRPRVLFICVHNSARSQMAEAYLRKYGGDIFDVESAGLTPGALNPRVVRALAEEGIDISGKVTQSVEALYRSGKTYSFVITVCNREAEENCPIFPGPVHRLNWPFPDPSGFTGSESEVAKRVRELRESIRTQVQQFVARYRTSGTVVELA